jgi:hypothetical protein
LPRAVDQKRDPFPMLQAIKNALKRYWLPIKYRQALSPATQIGQRQLFHTYRAAALNGHPIPLIECGFKVFSQFEEDGLVLALLGSIGLPKVPGRFVDIGAHDGVNSNAANWAIHFGWHGLFIDGDKAALDRGRRFYNRYPDPFSYKPIFLEAFVTAENIDTLLVKSGFEGEIDLLSIDLDGNDYYIWQAITVIQPRIVIIEVHIEYGLLDRVAPYDPKFMPGDNPLEHGASTVAMSRLGLEKGYKLVACNALGHNHIYLRSDLAANFLTLPVEDTLLHPSAKAAMASYEKATKGK